MIGDQRERIASTAREFIAADDADLFARLALPAVALERSSPGSHHTHLGGNPVIPSDCPWPHWDAKPLSLVCVVDLAELADFDTGLPVPEAGLLHFFYEADEQMAWGFDPAHRDGWRVVYVKPRAGQARQAPQGALTFQQIPLQPVQILSIPGWEEDVVAPILERHRKAFLALHEHLWASGLRRSSHQLGGWPHLQQNPIQLECQLASNGICADASGYRHRRARRLRRGAAEWRLLAQIDTDEEAGWMWGDAGSLYYAMRTSDLESCKYERTWMILQCG